MAFYASGNRVHVNSVTRVRIPICPLEKKTIHSEIDMLPPSRTVKQKTVLDGGNIMSRTAKVEASKKLQIVEEYLSGKISRSEAGRKSGVDGATVGKWASRYKAEGAEGLIAAAKNKTYTKETKLFAVIDYLSGKGSMLEICERYSISSDRQLRNWINVYNCHEEFRIYSGGSRMTKTRETTLAERIAIAKECISNNNNYGETALKYQVSYQQVYGWVKKYAAMGEAGLEDRRGRRAGTLPSRTPEEELRDRIAQLERDKLYLEMENTLLKKVKEVERRRR